MKKALSTTWGITLAALVLLLGGGGVAQAAHDAGFACYGCHTLSGAQVQPGTAFLSQSAMTESVAAGWTSSRGHVGCTFCHRSQYNSRIGDALTSFAGAAPGGTSRHPVSRNFVDNTIDNTAYLINDNSVTQNRLDCTDCHDKTLTTFPNHNDNWLNDTGATAQQRKTSNPYGLRLVSAPTAYDDLCRACHTSIANFQTFTGKTVSIPGNVKKLALFSHSLGTDLGANLIADADNTPMRTSTAAKVNGKTQCTACHDSHDSQNDHLFADGHELDNTGAAETAITELTNCTNVCHFAGDNNNSYNTWGHGKATNWAGISLGRNCTFCHDVSKPHNMGAGTSYEDKYRFPTLTSSWKDNSVFGFAQYSICKQCHGSKPVHEVKIGGVTNAVVGCLDCHDQHAKNSDNNVMMIRNLNKVAGSKIAAMTAGAGYTPGTEAVRFTTSPKYPRVSDNDFFTNVGYNVPGSQDNTFTGFCDQRACHGARLKDGVSLTPLSTFLSSGFHTGGNQSVRSDCEGCHKHEDGGGSFAANQSCTACHGYPPPPADNQAGNSYGFAEAFSPHVKHATTYSIACKSCHYRLTDNAYHNTTSNKSYQSVFFDNAAVRDNASRTPYYNPDNTSGTNCENIWCHSDGRGGAPVDNNYRWFTPPQPGTAYKLGCNGCHGGDPAQASPIATGAHAKHLAQGYKCAACHVKTVATDCNLTINPVTGSGATHLHADNVRNVNIQSTYDSDGIDNNNWSSATATCSNITCHGLQPVTWVTDIGRVTCDKCHVGTGDLDDFGAGSFATMDNNGVTARLDNTEWTTRGHGRDTGSGNYPVSGNAAANLLTGSTGTNKCAFCHDPAIAHDNASNPFRLAKYDVVAGSGWNGACYACHNAAGAGVQPATDCTGSYANKTAAKKVADEHFNPGSTNNARHSDTYNGGKFCYDCHEPHGDTNIYMVGSRVHRRTDNTYGFPVRASSTDNTNRPVVVFTTAGTGASYASTDNAAPYDGVCEACHQSQAAIGASNGVTHFWDNASSNHYTNDCIGCHGHDAGFRGSGGSNQEQFFDNTYNTDNAANYKDLSGHRVKSGVDNATGLQWTNQRNCYSCHGTANSTRWSNECLKCHYENRTDNTVTAHPDGNYQWNTPANTSGVASPGTFWFTTSTASGLDNDDRLCLFCHGLGGTVPFNAVAPPVVIQAGDNWTTGSGHGATATLSGGAAPGPPAYHCADCHKSTAAQSGGSSRDNLPGGFHGSRNRKLVKHETYATPEYPSPVGADGGFTVITRANQMEAWCTTKCHRNTTNGQPKDDNVIDHSWSVALGQSKAAGQSHPTNVAMVDNALYNLPGASDNLVFSDYISGTMPGTGRMVCTTCHDTHGGWQIRNFGGASLTGGAKNMLILSPADNVSTLCKKCHA